MTILSSRRKIDRYMASLPTTGTSDAVAEQAADRQLRMEEADSQLVLYSAQPTPGRAR
ncbi:hypothetical protein [Desulfovibrio sp. MES5]|uniref:hypothetical protein n=1 Tax=Desulfovibrio sp. MES5 TaxID=1899016 RepID=UPI0025BF51C8|nr:hypothetical protein [Desulfovibrio sp. MES5]